MAFENLADALMKSTLSQERSMLEADRLSREARSQERLAGMAQQMAAPVLQQRGIDAATGEYNIDPERISLLDTLQGRSYHKRGKELYSEFRKAQDEGRYREARNIRREFNKLVPGKSALLQDIQIAMSQSAGPGVKVPDPLEEEKFKEEKKKRLQAMADDFVPDLQEKYGSMMTSSGQVRQYARTINEKYVALPWERTAGMKDPADIIANLSTFISDPSQAQRQAAQMIAGIQRNIATSVEAINADKDASEVEKTLRTAQLLVAYEPLWNDNDGVDNIVRSVAEKQNYDMLGPNVYQLHPDTAKSLSKNLVPVTGDILSVDPNNPDKKGDFLENQHSAIRSMADSIADDLRGKSGMRRRVRDLHDVRQDMMDALTKGDVWRAAAPISKDEYQNAMDFAAAGFVGDMGPGEADRLRRVYHRMKLMYMLEGGDVYGKTDKELSSIIPAQLSYAKARRADIPVGEQQYLKMQKLFREALQQNPEMADEIIAGFRSLGQ